MAGKMRRRSNNRSYWDPKIASLDQYIGIVRMEEKRSHIDGSLEDSKLKEAMRAALRTVAGTSATREEMADPSHRSFHETMKVMRSMKGHLDQSLYDKICSDVDDDKSDLESSGFKFADEHANTGTCV